MIISILSISHYPPFLPSFLLSSISPFSRCQKKAGARAKPPSGAQSSGAPAAPPSETGSRGSSIRRASSQAAKSPTPVTSPSETGAVSKGRQTPLFLPSVVVVPCNVQCRRLHAPIECLRSFVTAPFVIVVRSRVRGSFRPPEELRKYQSLHAIHRIRYD